MKKKKAFTLVELLAVIVILAIILLIVVPNVMKIISNTKINAYNRQLDMLKDTTKKYVASYKLPLTTDTTDITLQELYDNNMIKDARDPRCGKLLKPETVITVTKLDNNRLDYQVKAQSFCEGDATPPVINNINTSSTTNSITVVVNAYEDSGNIKKYYYSNDNGSNYIETTNSTYTFTSLNKDTNYEIKVIVENNDGLKITSETITTKTSNIEGALFTINPTGDIWAREKEVTITYPSDKGSLVYSYTLDGITYTEVVGNTYTHKFSDNSSIQARIFDGTNTIDTTQSITKIDNTPPTSVSASTSKTTNSILVTANGIDNESGIKEYYYSKDNKATWIKGVGNTYNFTNLTSGTYNISVKLVNNAGGETISDIVSVTLSTIVAPTFTVNPSSDIWTKEKTVTITYPSDKGSLVYSYTLDGITYTEISGNTYTHKFSENSSIQARITDGVNTIDATQSITKIDNTGPTIPTSGNIGVVSGSNTTGTIQTQASGSTDEGVGNITYKYLVTNNSTIPGKDDANFTTNLNFTRSCGTSYYAYAIAEDSLGNRSEVKALGSTSDGVDVYSSWGTCSKTCGGGVQTRTNTCALKTDLSQSCNIQNCIPTLIEKMEQVFGKSTGGCVPESIPSGTSLYVDTNCAYAGINGSGDKTSGNATLKDPVNNYIMFNGSKYRIMKVAKDGDGKVGIRALAPANLISGTYQFHTSDNAYWDNASIRTNLNTAGQTLYNTIMGTGATANSNLLKLTSMKYDKGTTTDCYNNPGCGMNQTIGWTINSNYVGLPTIREMQQMRGIVGLIDLNKNNTWSILDSSNVWHWLLSPSVFSSTSYDQPGAWMSLYASTDYSYLNTYYSYNRTYYSHAVRAILNIAPSTPVIGGDGSINNPYILG